MNETAHIFSFFYEHIPVNESLIRIKDTHPLFHRIVHVLRLQKDDRCIFFDRQKHMTAFLTHIGSREIGFTLQQAQNNVILKPKITCLLPLLKREAFDEAIYSLTECGVSSIQLIVTKKIHRSWAGEKERDRVMRVIIAAAEQAKYYAFPECYEPKSLKDALADYESNATLVWCDPSGISLRAAAHQLVQQHSDHIVVLVGPEGDFSPDEKTMLAEKGLLKMALTPTILRAHQAAMLAVGALRSDLNS